jgi:hypothetical protein
MRGQNPLVLYTLLSKDIDQEFQKKCTLAEKVNVYFRTD